MTSDADCACDLNGEDTACIEGRVYGPCSDERCGGVCEYKSPCTHHCHAQGEPTVNTCCADHINGACCDPDDCGPCCRDCPECPTLRSARAAGRPLP